jgi:hypothetical protein
MRSLVSLALFAAKPIVAAFIHDGRPVNRHFRAAFDRQLERYPVARSIELTIPTSSPAIEPGCDATTAMAAMGILSVVCDAAAGLRVDRVIWPVAPGLDSDAVARVVEVVQLVEQLVNMGGGAGGGGGGGSGVSGVSGGSGGSGVSGGMRIDTPLVGLTGRQIVELGQQMGVPWEMSRSCGRDQAEPCCECEGCRWRYDGMMTAGVEDPLSVPAKIGQRMG